MDIKKGNVIKGIHPHYNKGKVFNAEVRRVRGDMLSLWAMNGKSRPVLMISDFTEIEVVA